jgi:hypothetical protein
VASFENPVWRFGMSSQESQSLAEDYTTSILIKVTSSFHILNFRDVHLLARKLKPAKKSLN